MKRIGFYPNLEKDFELSITKKMISFVISMGHFVSMAPEFANYLPDMPISFSDDFWHQVDFAVVLGGDGTVLRSAHHAAFAKTPILGINLGNIGYLTDAEQHGAKTAITKVLAGDFVTEKRMMLEANFLSGDENKRYLALNDVAISRGHHPKLFSCRMAVNGEFLDTIKGDGLIIATPTGSTAYSLAAGGPILNPNANMIAITPICAHCLVSRPTVVSHRDVIDISFVDISNVTLSIDGQVIDANFAPNSNSHIQIKRSAFCTHIIKTSNHSFYQTLRMKMMTHRN